MTVTDLLLAEVGIVLLAAILLFIICRQRQKRVAVGKMIRLQIGTAGQTRRRKIHTDSHRRPGISDPAADPADPDGKPHVADRRYDGGDREHISQGKCCLYRESSYGDGIFDGDVLTAENIVPAHSVRGHQPFYGYGTRRRGVSSDPLHYATAVLCSLRKPGKSTFSGKFFEKTDVFADRGNTVQYRGLYARSGWI